MTICKILATTKKENYTITVYENYDKFSSIPYYQIVIAKKGIAIEVIKTSKTTWKKRFNKLIKE